MPPSMYTQCLSINTKQVTETSVCALEIATVTLSKSLYT